MNQVALVGRIVDDLKVIEEEGLKHYVLTIAVTRSYKNVDGVYETDFIPCTILGYMAERTKEYCTKGDMVGIKGTVTGDGNKVEIIADKLTFLKSGVKNNEGEEN